MDILKSRMHPEHVLMITLVGRNIAKDYLASDSNHKESTVPNKKYQFFSQRDNPDPQVIVQRRENP